ncbi:MAG: hypothetical protein HYS25_09275 [Ignavibacteriales bacterium]|nr:hypothetical protein [Ignavibacteriales bacterium]
MKNYKVRIAVSIAAFVFLSLAALEIMYSILNSGENNFFLLKEGTNGKEVVFNYSLLNKYYNNVTSTPYNFCTSFDLKKHGNVYRVFLLGEASVSGWPYSTNQSLQKKIEKITGENHKGKSAEIITLSFAGFNSSQALDLVKEIFEYKPDLIIIYTGHNEFYGYNGCTTTYGKTNLFITEAVENIFIRSGIIKTISYDSKYDDLEVLLPLNAGEKILHPDQKKYVEIKEQFFTNISKIASLCKENKTELVISTLADNYMLPPVGVMNLSENISADLIYNNARMALMRDGDQNEALNLFQKSKDMDALRLRIPEEFGAGIKQISSEQKILLADLKSEFMKQSTSRIPGNDLFGDYFHPNEKGLEIIARVYAEIILDRIGKNKSAVQNETETDQFTKDNSIETAGDLLLARMRIDRSLNLLKEQNFFQSSEWIPNSKYRFEQNKNSGFEPVHESYNMGE